jgi:hypothetical protein
MHKVVHVVGLREWLVWYRAAQEFAQGFPTLADRILQQFICWNQITNVLVMLDISGLARLGEGTMKESVEELAKHWIVQS